MYIFKLSLRTELIVSVCANEIPGDISGVSIIWFLRPVWCSDNKITKIRSGLDISSVTEIRRLIFLNYVT